MSAALKPLYVTQEEAEWILDSFKVSIPQSKALALKAAGLVLEFAGADGVAAAEQYVRDARAAKIAENAARLGLMIEL